MNITNMSIMAHNEAVFKKAEAVINEMLEIVKEHGGKIWIQSQNNKEHYYEITEPISLNYYTFMSDDHVRINI